MNKTQKTAAKIIVMVIIVIVLLFLFVWSFFLSADTVNAQSNDLILKTTKECTIKYAGDSCITELNLENNVDNKLEGEAFLHIDYNGSCGNDSVDGMGIVSQLYVDDKWIVFSEIRDKTMSASDFKIYKDNNNFKLKIESAPNLCPGKYVFTLEIQGTDLKTEETHRTSVGITQQGQYTTNYMLELQIQIIKLKIQIITILIQLQQTGQFIFQNRF